MTSHDFIDTGKWSRNVKEDKVTNAARSHNPYMPMGLFFLKGGAIIAKPLELRSKISSVSMCFM